jgi:hypothetical protein
MGSNCLYAPKGDNLKPAVRKLVARLPISSAVALGKVSISIIGAAEYGNKSSNHGIRTGVRHTHIR